MRRGWWRTITGSCTTALGCLGLTVACICVAPLSCSAQNANCFSVRVLHQKSAKPIKGVQIHVSLEEPPSYMTMDKTDKQGIVRYCLPNPAPRWFRLDFYEFSGPDEQEKFETETVLKHGVIGKFPPHERKLKHTPDPRPGEVVIFGERWWLIDRWLKPWP